MQASEDAKQAWPKNLQLALTEEECDRVALIFREICFEDPNLREICKRYQIPYRGAVALLSRTANELDKLLELSW